MTNVADQQKMTLPVVLAIMAGTLMAVGGIVTLSVMSYHTMYGGHRMLGIMMGGASRLFAPQIMTSWITAAGISSIVCGVVVFFSSFKMHENPPSAKLWGGIILVCSIVGLFFANGFGIGSLIGIAAGVIAIVKR